MTHDPQADANADCARLAAEAIAVGCDESHPRIVYISPGSRSTPLVLAFAVHPHIEIRVVLDERAAAFAALGAATASGRTVCTLCTSGSATAHALPAVMEAFHACVPMLVLTADRPLEAQGIGAPQTTAQGRIYEDHTLAQLALPAPVGNETSARRQVEGQWRLCVAQALFKTQHPVPGPVHVNLPLRDPLGVAPSKRHDLPGPVRHGALMANTVNPAVLNVAHHIVRQGKRVVVVVGPNIPALLGNAPFAQSLGQLASAMHWPIVAESSANLPWGLWDESHSPVFISCGDAWAMIKNLPASMRPDVWIHFGLSPSGRALLRASTDPCARHIMFHPHNMPIDSAHVGDVFLAGDPVAWLQAWEASQGAIASEQKQFAKDVQALHQSLQRTIDTTMATLPFFEGHALRDIFRTSPTNSCFVLGNSLTIRDIDTFAAMDAAHASDTLMLSRRGVSGIDGALAHAAGVLTELQRRPLLCCLGDLTFLYDIQSLRLLVEQKKSARVFVLDNGGGEIFSQLPVAKQSAHFNQLFRTPQNVNARGLCEAQGANFFECDTREALSLYLQSTYIGQRTDEVDVVRITLKADAREARQQMMFAIENILSPTAAN